jgi:hypothetical protein
MTPRAAAATFRLDAAKRTSETRTQMRAFLKVSSGAHLVKMVESGARETSAD